MLYELYGLPVESKLPLRAPRLSSGRPAVKITAAPALFFQKRISGIQESSKGIDYRLLPGGAAYIRFFRIFQFIVSSDGRKIYYRKMTAPPRQSKTSLSPVIFLQTNVFSFSLLKLGIETFHASSIALGTRAIALLGESGYGKSTLAASFLKKGLPLLTDDVLAVRGKDKRFLILPGAAQIKLWPVTAKKILAHSPSAGKMTPAADKIILPLKRKTMAPKACGLGVIYVLWPRFKKGARAIRIRRLKPQDGVMALIKSSHNLVLQDAKRLQDQMMFASKLAGEIPIRGISFPMDLKKIPRVRDLILRDALRVFAQRQKEKRPREALS